MIVIPRKQGESIVVADKIIIRVIEVQADNVRLAIERLPDDADHEEQIGEVVLQEKPARKRPR